MKRLYALSEATNEPLTDARLKIYVEALADLPYDELRAALEGMIKTCAWFPKIPEIREAVIGNPEQAEIDAQWQQIASRIESWSNTMADEADCYASGFSCYNPTLSMKGLSELAKLVLARLGGPRAVAASDSQYLPLLKKQFTEEYKHVLQEHPHLKQLESSPLAGFLKSMDGEETKQ
jgi:hypothetical protein